MKNEPLLNEFADLRKKIEMRASNGIEIDVADEERFGILENTKLRFDQIRNQIRKNAQFKYETKEKGTNLAPKR